MQVTRLHTGGDGRSHFEDIELELEDFGGSGRMSEPWPARSVVFREVSGDYDWSFHNAPRRQFIVNLTGSVEIELGDGTKRRFGPGSTVLAEDTTGQGHISRAVGGEPRTCLVIPLEDD